MKFEKDPTKLIRNKIKALEKKYRALQREQRERKEWEANFRLLREKKTELSILRREAAEKHGVTKLRREVYALEKKVFKD